LPAKYLFFFRNVEVIRNLTKPSKNHFQIKVLFDYHYIEYMVEKSYFQT